MNVHVRDPELVSAIVHVPDAHGVLGPASADLRFSDADCLAGNDLSLTFTSAEVAERAAKALSDIAERMRAADKGEADANSVT